MDNSERKEALPVTEEALLTRRVQETMAEVRDILYGRDGIFQRKGYPYADLLERNIGLLQGIRSVAENASSSSFDTVVYPFSGSDISTGVRLLSPNAENAQLITIDSADLYAEPVFNGPPGLNHIVGLTQQNLDRRLISGWHFHGRNAGIANLALELNLLGVDPESFSIEAIDRISTKNGDMIITKSHFRTLEGKEIAHTHIAGAMLPDQLETDDPFVKAADQTILDTIQSSQRALVLHKAGDDYLNGKFVNRSARFYSLFPDKTVILSDTEEMPVDVVLQGRGKSLDVLFAERQRADLAYLHHKYAAPQEGLSAEHKIAFGYQQDIAEIKLYKLKSHPLPGQIKAA
jgi:hypothetical protein